MPLYIADYLADTVHLTAAEHGAYLLLIMRYWQDGGLPSDERLIARYSRMTPDQWAESRDVLAALFDDGWRHHRIDGELARASEIVTKRKAAAVHRHSKRDAHAVHVQSKSTYPRVPPSPTPSSEANASGADAPPDERTKLFRDGLETVRRMTGRPPETVRKLLGRWLKALHDDCRGLNRILEDAATANPVEPVAWIEGVIRSRGTGPPRGGQQGGFASIALELRNNDDQRRFDQPEPAYGGTAPHAPGVVALPRYPAQRR
jgi:uncharacterized protein YdaU (DUF1376 family)